LELVTDKTAKSWTSERLPAAEFVDRHLAPAAAEAGVLCRLAIDAEGNPLLQLSPPLVADAAAIGELVGLVEQALDRAVASGGLRSAGTTPRRPRPRPGRRSSARRTGAG